MVGCPHLKRKVREIKPKVHVFGHIHEGMGIEESDGTTFINASVVDFRYNLYGTSLHRVNVEPSSENLV